MPSGASGIKAHSSPIRFGGWSVRYVIATTGQPLAALTIDAVVRDGKLQIVDEDSYRLRVEKAAKGWGEGRCLTIRIEPTEDALTAGQRRYYFGVIIGALEDYTGYRKDEWHVMLKVQFMPDGKTSITQLNHDEMRDYIDACEQWGREMLPDAFVLYERGVA